MPDDTLSSSPALPACTPGHAHDLAEACAIRTGQWIATALDPRSFDVCLFAKLIAAREVRAECALLGLSEVQWLGLASRHFPRAQGWGGPAGAAGIARAAPSSDAATISLSTHEHVEFISALRTLMLQYANPAVHEDDAQCLASIIANACLRPDHLWRDLGLAGREEVSAMLERYFPSLAALNVENLRWKKFLARQLALSLGREPGPAPGCPGCEDYGFCFPDGS